MSDFEENKKRWDEGFRSVITCKKCGDSVHSKYSGQFVSCKCDSVFIDQTPYYARYGGNMEDMEFSEINIKDDIDEELS